MKDDQIYTFQHWLERLEELALEAGIRLPYELQRFEGYYRDGLRPVDTLELFIRENDSG